MATFPPITPQNLGQTPESSAPGDYDITTQIPVPGAANALKAVLTGSAVGSYTYDNILSGSYGQILADSLVSSGIIDGMELSIGAPATTINIAPGKYVTKNPGAETYSINTFAGVHSEPITLAPQSTAWFVFVNIDAQGTIYFESERGTRTKVCVGGIEVKGTTTASRVYNTGSRIENSGDEFDQFLNDIGVFQRGIVVGLKGNGKIVNTGGIVYAGSVYRGRIVQASSAQTVTTIDDTGTLGQPLTTLTIAALKIYKPVGGADTPLTGNNQFGLWFVFVDLQGNFYLMKPQEEVDPVNNTNITDSDIYQAYEKLVLPEIINTNATLVGCLIVEGNSNDLSDVTVQDLVNKPLSSTEGNKIPGGTPVPVPVARVFQDQEEDTAFNPLGQYQLATDGTDIVFKKGLEAAVLDGDGPIANPMFDANAPLTTVPLQWGNTGEHSKPEVYYVVLPIPSSVTSSKTPIHTIDFPSSSIISNINLTGLPATITGSANFIAPAGPRLFTLKAQGPLGIAITNALPGPLGLFPLDDGIKYITGTIFRNLRTKETVATLASPGISPPNKPYLDPTKPNYINTMGEGSPMPFPGGTSPATYIVATEMKQTNSVNKPISPSLYSATNSIFNWATNKLSAAFFPLYPTTTPLDAISYVDGSPGMLCVFFIKIR